MGLRYVLLLLTASCLSACVTTGKDRTDSEACFEIAGSKFSAAKSYSVFEKSQFKGFIVAVDKSKYAKFVFPSNDEGTQGKLVVADETYFDFSSTSDLSSKRLQQRIDKTLHHQDENLFITGISAHGIPSNLKIQIKDGCGNSRLTDSATYIQCSAQALDSLQNEISEILRSQIDEPYTHILLYSTGWNNTPSASQEHYTELQMTLEDEAGKNFRPLFIGITWPSKWKVPFFSLFNKKHDADELGLIWLNYLMNKTVPNAIKEANLSQPPKFVALGHSLGARAMATAAISQPYVNGASALTHPHLDSLILLQPAFSGSRFYIDPDKKSLGHFKYYEGIENYAPATIVTSSKFDKALPRAFWADNFAGHIGGRKAHTRTCKKVKKERGHVSSSSNSYWDSRYICQQQDDGTQSQWGELSRQDNRILLLRLDANKKKIAIVKNHSDVKNAKIAKVIWELIK